MSAVHKARQGSDDMQKVVDLIADIGVGMVTALDVSSGMLVSRPMMALEVDADARLWFFSKTVSCYGLALGRVNVAFADVGKGRYVSVSGRASVINDRAHIQRLWSSLAKPWFPDGSDDPHLILLRVDLCSAEYWDSNSSNVVRILAIAAAAVIGEPIRLGVNKRVLNPHASPS